MRLALTVRSACRCLALALSAACAIPAAAATPAAADPPIPDFSAAQLAAPTRSVVRVTATIVPDGRTVDALGKQRSGSGIVLDPLTVLTIGYLVVESDAVEIETASGKRLPATLAGYDHATGFGLLRVALPVDAAAAELGDSDAVVERQTLLTAGQGEPAATPVLAVSRKPFSGSWEYLLETPIFTFPPVDNWSGSALFDERGRLVGVGSLIVQDATGEGRGIPGNLFVPINLLKPILPDLLKDGRRAGPAAPWLGVTTETLKGELTVVRVAEGGPAQKAGVRAGDVIIGIGGTAVGNQADFYRKLQAVGPAGSEVPLQILARSDDGRPATRRVRSIDRADFLKRASGI